jgi:hypothetical protein
MVGPRKFHREITPQRERNFVRPVAKATEFRIIAAQVEIKACFHTGGTH